MQGVGRLLERPLDVVRGVPHQVRDGGGLVVPRLYHGVVDEVQVVEEVLAALDGVHPHRGGDEAAVVGESGRVHGQVARHARGRLRTQRRLRCFARRQMTRHSPSVAPKGREENEQRQRE